MSNVNFYLKEPKATLETPISLHFHFRNTKLKFAIGEKIHHKKWSFESQRAKKNYTGASDLNDYLDKVGEDIKRIYRQAQTNNVNITTSYLKGELTKALDKSPINNSAFFDSLTEYSQLKTGKVSSSYIKKINTLKNHLKEFEKVKRFKVAFENIDLRFYDAFTSYLLKDCKHLNNTVGSNISVLKTFMNWATSRKVNTNLEYRTKEFAATKQEGDVVYLKNSELMKLYEFDLSNNKKLYNVRETFCFGCFTGLRFSDISKVKKENIHGEDLHIITQKTEDKLIIPLNDYALDILKRNNYFLPVISNQKTNSYLKELGELAEINESVVLTRFRGKDRIEVTEPKYNHLSTHTARRTFVTLSLERGMRKETVMAITGHKNDSTFKRYVVITEDVKRVEMKQVWSKKTKLRKVS